MAAPALRWFPLAVLLTVALWLRVADLGMRPMHSDEANQAVKAGELLESGRYAIDPRDHHGPTLYYAVLPVAWLRGERTLAALTETTVRLVPAFAGALGVLLLVGCAAPLGRWPALAAGAWLAVSPPAVYYSRYFIQETLLATFFLAAVFAGGCWWRTGRLAWAATAGGAVGLMFATKATAPLFLVAAAAGLLIARPPRPSSPRVLRDVAVGCATALIVAVLLFSSFGTHVAGLRDALAAYGFGASRATAGSGHEKPWWYYLQLFGLERRGGLVWQQLGFAALAACGAALTVLVLLSGRGKTTNSTTRTAPIHRPGDRSPDQERRAARTPDSSTSAEAASRSIEPGPAWPARGAPRQRVSDEAARLLGAALAYTLVVAVVLSAIPYKTPWHVIHFVPGLAVLAAGALAILPRARMGLLLAVLVIYMQAGQTWLTAFQRPADERNPYAYVHSSPDVRKVRVLVEAALGRDAAHPARVIGEEYWPLPWYLRGLDRVGYWTVAPPDCDGAIVLACGSQVETVRSRLHGPYRETYLGLRPDVLCVVFTPSP